MTVIPSRSWGVSTPKFLPKWKATGIEWWLIIDKSTNPCNGLHGAVSRAVDVVLSAMPKQLWSDFNSIRDVIGNVLFSTNCLLSISTLLRPAPLRETWLIAITISLAMSAMKHGALCKGIGKAGVFCISVCLGAPAWVLESLENTNLVAGSVFLLMMWLIPSFTLGPLTMCSWLYGGP